MPLRLATVLICIAAVTGCVEPQQRQTFAPDHTQLIERTKLLGNPGRQFCRISPDGKWLAWLAPHDGVVNLWIAPTTLPSKARLLTQEGIDRVWRYVWSPDSASLFYTQDRGGNQNFVLYSVSLAGGPSRPLTPTENTRAQIVAVSPLVRDRILVGLNSRDPRWQDLYSLDVKSGDLTLLLQNDGYSSFIADPNLVVRAALRARADGGSDVHIVDSGRIAAAPFESIPYEDVRTTSLLGYSADGQTLHWRDSRGRDTAALVAHDLRTGEKKVLGGHPRADVVATSAHPTTGQVDAYEVNPLKSEWTGLTPQTRRDFDRLSSQIDGEIEISARTAADDQWVLLVKAGHRPSTSYLYDRASGRITKLSDSRDDLESVPLGDKHAVFIRSRDGLMQSAYLTLPTGSDRDGDGRPEAPLPMVLFVHGGPWERSDFGYQSYAAFFADRGYAVLSPNFRGSTGFGKAYVSAGDGEWGAKMQDDLVDAVEWAISQGIAVRDKVAIHGGSYGGYAVLAALAFTPQKFACGVDLFGTSNLRTQVEGDAARREFRRAEYYRRIGDPTTGAGRALLAERSPIFRADAISRPLLVAQGANDPQVKKAQSDELVEALRSRGASVTYLVFPDEGHGFTRPENGIALSAVEEHFLARCLGGRAEPFGQSLRSSSLIVPQGAQFVEGLQEALAKAPAENLP
jgi:dipeptidyl aminopeptidase/acylaminoacyl peptidase